MALPPGLPALPPSSLLRPHPAVAVGSRRIRDGLYNYEFYNYPGLVGSRRLWSSATIAIDAQSDSASIPVLTASHRPAARPAGGRAAAVWHT